MLRILRAVTTILQGKTAPMPKQNHSRDSPSTPLGHSKHANFTFHSQIVEAHAVRRCRYVFGRVYNITRNEILYLANSQDGWRKHSQHWSCWNACIDNQSGERAVLVYGNSSFLSIRKSQNSHNLALFQPNVDTINGRSHHDAFQEQLDRARSLRHDGATKRIQR